MLVLINIILKVRKDFMLCNQRHTTTEETRPLCQCFVNSGFPRKADLDRAAVDNICKKRQQKKTFTFTVSWQKQIKLYVSSQKG